MMSFQKMGVINLTPDSFSDGGELTHASHLAAKINRYLQWNVDFIDVGAESTAPFNEPITEEVERERFRPHVKTLGEIPVSIPLSIDTYNLETFLWMASLLPSHQLIWNDVSGCVDDQLISFLRDHKFGHIFLLNFVPTRDKTNFHQDYIDEKDSWSTRLHERALSYMEEWRRWRQGNPYLDPGLGFSKTRKQSRELLHHPELIVGNLNSVPWVFGLSRKSFLQEESHHKLTYGKSDHEKLDREHSHWVSRLTNQLQATPLIFRAHHERCWTM